jgi:hypothetical protein
VTPPDAEAQAISQALQNGTAEPPAELTAEEQAEFDAAMEATADTPDDGNGGFHPGPEDAARIEENKRTAELGPSAAEKAQQYASESRKPDMKDRQQAAMRKELDRRTKAGRGDHAVKGQVMSDVDLDLDERTVITVRLGGKKWRATEPTIEQNKALTAMMDEIGPDATQREQAEVALNSLYPQVREILEDFETGEYPDREFVEKHMTSRGFGRLMQKLNEEGLAGN